MAQASCTPLDLSIHDPDFGRNMLGWASRAKCEMHELCLMTKETIAATRVMIAEADRMIAADCRQRLVSETSVSMGTDRRGPLALPEDRATVVFRTIGKAMTRAALYDVTVCDAETSGRTGR
jgi:hypothetical protein